MSWTAKGVIAGKPFAIAWDDKAGKLAPPAGRDPMWALLDASEGDEFTVPPTGPRITLDLSDPATVLGAAMTLGRVDEIDGDAPTVVHPLPDGAVA